MFSDMLIGLRNLRRRRLRTTLTALMIILSTTLVVFSKGLNEGTYSGMIELATASWSGHVQIQADGYNDNPSLFKTVKDSGAVMKAMSERADVASVTPRVDSAGLLAAGNRTTAALLAGVDPTLEAETTTLSRAVKEGTWLPPPDPSARSETEDDEDVFDENAELPTLPIVLGKGLAQRLKVSIGDEISFMGQAADGSIAAELFTVTGLLDSGLDELDANIAFIRISDAQTLFELGDRVHRIVVLLKDLDTLEESAASMRGTTNDVVLTWKQMLPELASSIEADRAGGHIFLIVIILVVLLGVANSMMMSVFERTREFGVMMAIGTSPRRIVGMTVWESFWLTGLSVALGTLLGILTIQSLKDTGIPLGSEPIEFGGVMISHIKPINVFTASVIYPVVIFVSGMIAGVLPALRAARLEPVKAIREN
jgi:putative ABC transport system permease protein